ncbi:MAG TPA: outer membrane protein transport protein [Pirellulales bacterium]|nr:outer membrane protein transport protein [Pirellulales bacterium]
MKLVRVKAGGVKYIAPLAALALLMAIGTSASAQGILLPFAGPINQSMGGASTAAPIDAAGAMFWNPASISGLQSSEMSLGLGMVLPTTSVASTATIPGVGTFSGSTQSQPGVMPIPTMAFVKKSDDSAWTYGIGVFSLGGFSTNYPASPFPTATSNPILTPQPPNGAGLGSVYAMSQIYQIAPTISCAVTDRLSIGVTPTISLAYLDMSPLVFSPPNPPVAAGGAAQYGPGFGTRFNWGGGVNLGAYYILNDAWHFGATIKSPQWYEPIRINSQNQAGGPTQSKLDFQMPMVLSFGTAYTGFQRLIVDLDLRYFDYANAHGFSQSGFMSNGAVAGLGWQSVFGLALGGQYLLTDRWTVRMGYSYNSNPVPNSQSEFNVASPLIYQNIISMGFSVLIVSNVKANLAYSHAFQNSITGPIYTAANAPIPGTSVTNTVSSDLLQAGLSVLF